MWISGLTTLTLFTSLTHGNALNSVIQTDRWTKQMVVFSQLLQWYILAHSNWVQCLERSELQPIQISALHWPMAITVSLMSKHSAASHMALPGAIHRVTSQAKVLSSDLTSTGRVLVLYPSQTKPKYSLRHPESTPWQQPFQEQTERKPSRQQKLIALAIIPSHNFSLHGIP